MPGEGRTFRRKTKLFWDIWPLPPKIEHKNEVVYVDGIYMGRKACILICCNDKHVLGWYLCRYEHSGAWKALMSRISEPKMVVSDGGSGFAKALKKTWPNAKHQRCIFHVFNQVKRYTTSKTKTAAGTELYVLAKDGSRMAIELVTMDIKKIEATLKLLDKSKKIKLHVFCKEQQKNLAKEIFKRFSKQVIIHVISKLA